MLAIGKPCRDVLYPESSGSLVSSWSAKEAEESEEEIDSKNAMSQYTKAKIHIKHQREVSLSITYHHRLSISLDYHNCTYDYM